jgi:hypothetical protein
MSHVVLGIASTRPQAEVIVQHMREAGILDQDISVLLPDRAGTRDFAHEQNTKAPEGAAAGATAGGTVGGVLGLLAGIGLLAIPGVGPFIAAGPILGALGGLGLGAAVGGIAGALVGLGIPEIEARVYEGKIRDGNILLSVHTRDNAQTKRVKEIFTADGAEDITSASTVTPPKS